jgi:hypothetical protein
MLFCHERPLYAVPTFSKLKKGNKKDVEEEVCKNTWWTERESNPRHKDFQSFALPTELSVHVCEAHNKKCASKFKKKKTLKIRFFMYSRNETFRPG